MASNLFHLRHNFLTRKCPSLLPTRHFLKHTEIYISSEMIAYAPQDILPNLPVLVRLGIYEKYREYFSFLLPSNSESPVALYRTTWKACHGDTGAKLPYESPPPSSTWPYRASCGDTDLLKLSTFVCTDWEEAILPFLTSSQWAFSLSAIFLIPVGNIFIHFCSRRLLFGHISVPKCAQKAPSSPFRARLAVFLCPKGSLMTRL